MNEMDSKSSNDRKYEVYLEERKLLIDAKREASRLFDRAILTLAAGAFGLSLTFIRQITPNIQSGTVLLLICAWAGFCISLLSTLVSFLTSQFACSREIKILKTVYFPEDKDQDKNDSSKNKLNILTRCLNILSIFAFMIGAISLVIFSILNLNP